MTCFADTNVSQGSVAKCARCDGIVDIRLTANLPRNLPVNFFLNQLRIHRIMVMCLWRRFLAHPVRALSVPYVCLKNNVRYAVTSPNFKMQNAILLYFWGLIHEITIILR